MVDAINDLLMGATKQLVDNPAKASELLDEAKKLLLKTKKNHAIAFAGRAKVLALEIQHAKRTKYQIIKDITSLANEIKKEEL